MRVMEDTGVITVTAHVAVRVPTLAVMVTLPALMAVTLPLWSTVATLLFDDDQLTMLLVVFSGKTVAVNVKAFPTAISTSVWSNDMDVGGITRFVTVTVQTADLSPTLAVITVDPVETPVTRPESETEAICGWAELHATSWLVALSGFTVAMS